MSEIDKQPTKQPTKQDIKDFDAWLERKLIEDKEILDSLGRE